MAMKPSPRLSQDLQIVVSWDGGNEATPYAPYQTLLPFVDQTRRLSDDFELLQSRLGRGEFAEVRLGLRKMRLSERVAVKVLSKANALMPERLQAEVLILRAIHDLGHPNLVKLLDAYETPDEVQLVFELLDRGTLLDHVAGYKGKGVPEAEAREMLRGVASGLRALHAIGVVHRDLKLQNVMLGENLVAKICDFGFAKRASAIGRGTTDTPGMARFASPCGTPGFIAPEVTPTPATHPLPPAVAQAARARAASPRGATEAAPVQRALLPRIGWRHPSSSPRLCRCLLAPGVWSARVRLRRRPLVPRHRGVCLAHGQAPLREGNHRRKRQQRPRQPRPGPVAAAGVTRAKAQQGRLVAIWPSPTPERRRGIHVGIRGGMAPAGKAHLD